MPKPIPRPIDMQDSIVRVGQPRAYLSDVYAFLLRSTWRRLILLCAGLYLLINSAFALLFVEIGECVQGARPGSFFDAFFFSVQTLATIGYGVMSPQGVCGHVLVSIEALFGLLGLALLTGIVFAKFSRPRSGVVFSRSAIIAPHNGVPCLLFRVANERGSDIVEASMRLSALMDATTTEGKALRRFYDLPLERSTTPLLLMSWLAVHRIDESSPLYGKTADECLQNDVRIIASITGMDGTFMQSVYAYHVYTADHIVHDADFVDVIRKLPDGRYELHLGKFHDLKTS